MSVRWAVSSGAIGSTSWWVAPNVHIPILLSGAGTSKPSLVAAFIAAAGVGPPAVFVFIDAVVSTRAIARGGSFTALHRLRAAWARGGSSRANDPTGVVVVVATAGKPGPVCPSGS